MKIICLCKRKKSENNVIRDVKIFTLLAHRFGRTPPRPSPLFPARTTATSEPRPCSIIIIMVLCINITFARLSVPPEEGGKKKKINITIIFLCQNIFYFFVFFIFKSYILHYYYY